MKRGIIRRVAVLTVLALLAVWYFVSPAFHTRMNGVVFLFTSKDIRTVAGYIRSYGSFSILVSVLLMLFQSFVPPFSYRLVVMANASVYGWIGGALVSWAGAVVGACVVFTVARALLQPVLAIPARRFHTDGARSFLQKNGGAATLFFRLLPFFPSDVVSIMAGVSPIRFIHYCMATALAELPYVIVWSYIGKSLTSSQERWLTTITILLAACVLFHGWGHWTDPRQNTSHNRSKSWRKGKS